VLFVCWFWFLSAQDSHQIVYQVEQSFDSGRTWSERGELTFKNSKNYRLADSKKLEESLKFDQQKITDTELDLLRNLVKNNDNYFVRVHPKSFPMNNNQYVMASVPACFVLSSNFVDSLTAHLDVNSNIISIDYIPNRYKCDINAKGTNKNWKTNIRLGFPEKGPSVNLTPFQQQKEEPVEQESFFSRYWIIFVGIGIYVIVSTLASGVPEAPQQ